MRRFLFLMAILCSFSVLAQEKTTDYQIDIADTLLSSEMNRILNAYIAIAEAAPIYDREILKMAADSLRSCNIIPFTSLVRIDTDTSSLNGHIVFNNFFVDSLSEWVNAYDQPETVDRMRHIRGHSHGNRILTKSYFVKADSAAVLSFKAFGHQELAVVAESGGLISLKIKVTNNSGFEKHFNDTMDVKFGRKFRKAVFDLPDSPLSDITLEVINCCNKDISFLVISN